MMENTVEMIDLDDVIISGMDDDITYTYEKDGVQYGFTRSGDIIMTDRYDSEGERGLTWCFALDTIIHLHDAGKETDLYTLDNLYTAAQTAFQIASLEEIPDAYQGRIWWGEYPAWQHAYNRIKREHPRGREPIILLADEMNKRGYGFVTREEFYSSVADLLGKYRVKSSVERISDEWYRIVLKDWSEEQ
ncbi:hypothetical protein [Brevibacillus migulae]|uniref:hypothetical protein n=1 Tax=Brevibacillus migulae TaxID=1644114 RepID=UPI00106DF811|nr:hypothetical protein [Brevibacillus migulae]